MRVTADEDGGKQEPARIGSQNENCHRCGGEHGSSSTTENRIPTLPSVPLLNVHPGGLKARSCGDVCTPLCTAALLITAEEGKQPSPSRGKEMSKIGAFIWFGVIQPPGEKKSLTHVGES